MSAMKMWALRIWTTEDLSPFAFTFLDSFERSSHYRIESFNTYGLDGSSYRIDLRFNADKTPGDGLIAFASKRLVKSQWWKDHILKVVLNEWKEPEEVKRGHILGTMLARRLNRYNENHPKDRIKLNPLVMMHFVAFILVNLWKVDLQVPYWHREFEPERFRIAYNSILRGIPVPPLSFAIIDRVLHNFLANLGFTSIGESTITTNLAMWFWMTRMAEQKVVKDAGV